MVSVGKASCSVLLQMRDVNLFLLKTYIKGCHLIQPDFFPPPLFMIPIQACESSVCIKGKGAKVKPKILLNYIPPPKNKRRPCMLATKYTTLQ